jgi:hypothetical protein
MAFRIPGSQLGDIGSTPIRAIMNKLCLVLLIVLWIVAMIAIINDED